MANSEDSPDSEDSQRELAILYGFIDLLPAEYRFKLIFSDVIFLDSDSDRYRRPGAKRIIASNELIWISNDRHWILEVIFPSYIYSMFGIFLEWDGPKPRRWLCLSDDLATVLQITTMQDLQVRWKLALSPSQAINVCFDLADPASCDRILKLLKCT
jgi:hypothetical protein